MKLGWWCSGDGDDDGGGFLKARVSRQELGTKGKEDKRSLNKFYSVRNGPPGPIKHRENATVHLPTQLKMTEGTNPHNGTIQRADFRLIHLALMRSHQITARTTHPQRRKGG